MCCSAESEPTALKLKPCPQALVDQEPGLRSLKVRTNFRMKGWSLDTDSVSQGCSEGLEHPRTRFWVPGNICEDLPLHTNAGLLSSGHCLFRGST